MQASTAASSSSLALANPSAALFGPATSSAPSPVAPRAANNPQTDDDDFDELADSDDAAASSSSKGKDKGKRPALAPASTSKRPASSSASPAKASTSSTASTSQGPPRKRHRTSTAAGAGGGSGHSGPYVPPPLPHYTVKRSSHNSRSSPHLIVINQDVSDGDARRWPPIEERQPGHKVNGRESWYECQDPDTGRHKSFREKVGEELAKKLNLISPGAKQEYWAIEELPAGHLFTVHHATTGSNQCRTDVYVFGSAATHKFRTANEFVPHLYWLLQHGPADTLKCECKYCAKRTQGDVNRIVGLTDGRASSVSSQTGGGGTPVVTRKAGGADGASGTATAKVARMGDPGTEKLLPDLAAGDPRKKHKGKKKRRTHDGGVDGAVAYDDEDDDAAGEGEGVARRLPTYKGSYQARQKDEDLASFWSARLAELVWAKLPTPLVSRDAQRGDKKITHWPGIVVRRKVDIDAKLVSPEGGDEAAPPQTNGTADGQDGEREKKKGEAKTEDGEGEGGATEDGDKAPAPLGPKHRFAVKQRYAYDVRLLAVMEELRTVPEVDVSPWLAHDPAAALSDSDMAQHEAVKHVWDGERITRGSKLRDFECYEDAVTVFGMALQVAACLVVYFCTNERYVPTSDHIEEQPNLNVEQKAAVEEQRSNCGFQSLTWGAEHIWAGDVVRILPDAAQFDFALEDFAKAAKLSPETLRETMAARGPCLRIVGIYMHPEQKRLKLAGQLFQLVDDDVASPSKSGADGVASAPQSNGTTSTSDSSSKGGVLSALVNGASDSRAARTPPPVEPRPLPPAPAGTHWVQLTAPDAQLQVDVELLGGRYHPPPIALNTREKVAEIQRSLDAADDEVNRSRSSVDGEDGAADSGEVVTATIPLSDEQRRVCLAALRPALRLYMQCGVHQPDRFATLVAAENETEVAIRNWLDSNGLLRNGDAAGSS
ncbi:uncharacterized protein JCM10292_003306 [Rhodotorula paludigena]|uniref:uncharacterized protein n=1 Tax=Rhodotorula paludigena TaxID=86838 RepID=UPI00317F9516